MRLDDETTATQLHELLTHNGISLSLRTILRCREQLGWTFRGSAYCQLIRDVNKQKRLDWGQGDHFEMLYFLTKLLFRLKHTDYVVTERKEKDLSLSLARNT